MRQPAKPKPQAHEEVARVLHVYQMLAGEIKVSNGADSGTIYAALLAVAERIAARTEG